MSREELRKELIERKEDIKRRKHAMYIKGIPYRNRELNIAIDFMW